MFNSYEEYMQSMLGMNMPNTYMQSGGIYNNPFYDQNTMDMNRVDVNKLYPEIYGIVYPMVQKSSNTRRNSTLNESLVNEIVDEVYNAVQSNDDTLQGNGNANTLKNGDVRNPRAKETKKNDNLLLRDLIKILVIRELLQNNGRDNTQQRATYPRDATGAISANAIFSSKILKCNNNGFNSQLKY